MSNNLQHILDKYGDIIKEEVNVKDISVLPNDIKIEKIFVPLGRNISSKFGKDTGSIIKFAKMGNVKELEEGRIKVYGDEKEWTLDQGDYEIRYSGDINEQNTAIEEGVIVRLDLNIDEELKKEGLIREISRFVNQLRKEAGYNVDDRVKMYYFSNDENVIDTIEKYKDFLKKEALLKEILLKENLEGDIKEKMIDIDLIIALEK